MQRKVTIVRNPGNRRLTEDDADYLVSATRLKEPTASLSEVTARLEKRLGRPINRQRRKRV